MSDKEFYKLFGLNESEPYQGSEQFGLSLKRYSMKKEHFIEYSTTTLSKKISSTPTLFSSNKT